MNFNNLIGKSVVGFEFLNDCENYLLISDGSKVKLECESYPGCCGYNDFTVSIPEGFDFNDNIILNVKYQEEDYDEYGCEGAVTLGIFTNRGDITTEGEFGSRSGWDYGQFVEFSILEVAE